MVDVIENAAFILWVHLETYLDDTEKMGELIDAAHRNRLKREANDALSLNNQILDRLSKMKVAASPLVLC